MSEPIDKEAEPCLRCGCTAFGVSSSGNTAPIDRKYVRCGHCCLGWEVFDGCLSYEVWGDNGNPNEAGTTWFEMVPAGCLAVFQWDEV
jgi:hypothetical protein